MCVYPLLDLSCLVFFFTHIPSSALPLLPALSVSCSSSPSSYALLYLCHRSTLSPSRSGALFFFFVTSSGSSLCCALLCLRLVPPTFFYLSSIRALVVSFSFTMCLTFLISSCRFHPRLAEYKEMFEALKQRTESQADTDTRLVAFRKASSRARMFHTKFSTAMAERQDEVSGFWTTGDLLLSFPFAAPSRCPVLHALFFYCLYHLVMLSKLLAFSVALLSLDIRLFCTSPFLSRQPYQLNIRFLAYGLTLLLSIRTSSYFLCTWVSRPGLLLFLSFSSFSRRVLDSTLDHMVFLMST